MVDNVLERFLGKFSAMDESQGGCWQWHAALTTAGYGHMSLNNKLRPAHRLSYEHFVGPIPEGLTLDHLCRNRACVNPAHLEPVTMKENVMRGESFAARNARKTHCPSGHEYTPENTYTDQPSRPGGRTCKACSRESARRQRKENGDAVRAKFREYHRAQRARRTPEEVALDRAKAAEGMRALRARRAGK